MFKKEPRSILTKGQVTEIVDELLRAAMRQQARSLERHLQDINKRLLALEEKK